MNKLIGRFADFATVYLRIGLGVAFLSAVADRFGWLGAPGTPNVSWGNFENFLKYTATLTPFVPGELTPLAGWVSTIAEIGLGIALILGIRIREAAFLSGILLFFFALGITVGTGFKRALDFSVFAASAGAFLLAAYPNSPLSVDALLKRVSPTKSFAPIGKPQEFS
jgi:uncharacterized membrane protein YphA (DoxX/SURF4 family)